jgi:hypothetical protein
VSILKCPPHNPHIEDGESVGDPEVSMLKSRYTVNASTFLVATMITFAPHVAWASKIIGNG